MSHFSASARPPAASISAAALWMVPGSFGFGTADFAAIGDVGPSARGAQGDGIGPIPREGAVMNRVLPAGDMGSEIRDCGFVDCNSVPLRTRITHPESRLSRLRPLSLRCLPSAAACG